MCERQVKYDGDTDTVRLSIKSMRMQDMDVFIPDDYAQIRRQEIKKRMQQQLLFIQTNSKVLSSQEKSVAAISPITPSITSPDQTPFDRIFGCITP
ncbi:hypothetical protein IFM89_005172 [Coptis chinensis]|uniref:Uncharacterized protein n=1 Tax=Coptis chinensis TaxID=261450 RepID=A0A835IM89_9MAGN|nr:hypothetical protein IFM89_005172 [Coptis chinensis]